ncbi:hypothetical protein WN55_06946 [Dufourea novaeangliae]|uniref:Uncharacterized protein n=1 Tax=Dufourea novaeangliae TaxID=178035 RepID=A0A154PRD5_DUFNO|nr:hypothetical protein WN55_06946 [Dufourea novaeangliae]
MLDFEQQANQAQALASLDEDWHLLEEDHIKIKKKRAREINKKEKYSEANEPTIFQIHESDYGKLGGPEGSLKLDVKSLTPFGRPAWPGNRIILVRCVKHARYRTMRRGNDYRTRERERTTTTDDDDGGGGATGADSFSQLVAPHRKIDQHGWFRV